VAASATGAGAAMAVANKAARTVVIAKKLFISMLDSW